MANCIQKVEYLLKIFTKNEFKDIIGTDVFVYPYTNHEDTVKSMENKGKGINIKFSTVENLISHYIKHYWIVEKNKTTRPTLTVDTLEQNMGKKRELVDNVKKYVQQARDNLSIILNYNSDKHDSSWNQINGTRNFDFYKIENETDVDVLPSYLISVKVGELGETFFATAFTYKPKKTISVSTFRRHHEVKWHDHPPNTEFLRCYYHMLECQQKKVHSDSPDMQ